MTTTIAILQARTSSTRLPRKVLHDLAGEPLLQRVIERASRAFKIDRLVVATSDEASDDPIFALCDRLNVGCYRGSLHDVLDRYYQTARQYEADHVVRLTADCPLIDPQLIDEIVARYRSSGCDYCSNTVERSFPVGLDAEVFSFAALEAAWQEASTPEDREHVTPFVWRQPLRFQSASVSDAIDRSHLRWTVDEPADLEFVRRVYGRLLPYDPAFTRDDVFALLEESPELALINANCGRPAMQSLRAAA